MGDPSSIDVDEHPKLKRFRQQIDALDVELLELLAKRLAIIKEVGAYKKLRNLPELDEQRWQKATAKRLAQAKNLDVSEELVANLFELLHSYTLKIESDIKNK